MMDSMDDGTTVRRTSPMKVVLMMMTFKIALVVAVLAPSFVTAFVVGPTSSSHSSARGWLQTTTQPTTTKKTKSSTTQIFLEDWVADMIDAEIWRQGHKKDFESQWMEKNRAAIVQSLGSSSSSTSPTLMTDVVDPSDFRQHARDAKMAKDDPQRYCADRCIATGNCDIYEDFFRMSAQEVIEFCSDCVISDGEEPCNLPESFFDDSDNEIGGLKP